MSIDAILDQRLFISTLSIAKSPSQLRKHAITHILTVCPGFNSTGKHHKVIPVEDSEFENLLIRLPEACEFIRAVWDESPTNKILVHCVLGVSRSVSVVAAYLMQSQQWSAHKALRHVESCRPQAWPNLGFRKQLEVFEECNYQPAPDVRRYREWLEEWQGSLSDFVEEILNSKTVIPHQLYYTTEVCESPDEMATFTTLLSEFRVSYLLSVEPSYCADIPNLPKEWFTHLAVPSDHMSLTILEKACALLTAATNTSTALTARAVVYSNSIERACLVCCAYLIVKQGISPLAAISLPQFASTTFSKESVHLLEQMVASRK